MQDGPRRLAAGFVLLAVVDALAGAGWTWGDAAPGPLALLGVTTGAASRTPGALLLVAGLLQLAVGVGLAARRAWARRGAWPLAVAGLVNFPFGTLLAAALLYGMLQPESGVGYRAPEPVVVRLVPAGEGAAMTKQRL